MKNLLLFLICFASSFFAVGQYPVTQVIGGDSSIVKSKGALQTVSGLVSGRYTDTVAANLTRIRQYPGAKIVTGDIEWIRNATATAWIRQAITSTSDCGLISGAIVTWNGLLQFSVSPAQYQLCCDMRVRNSVLTQVTLSAADASLNRFDLIAIDSTGVVVVTGTPAVNPSEPQPPHRWQPGPMRRE